MWILYSILASSIAMLTEYSYRNVFNTFWESLPYLIVPIMLLQWSLFKLFSTSPHWLMAWSTFFLVNAVGRVALSWWSGEQINMTIMVGVIVIACGALIISFGKV